MADKMMRMAGRSEDGTAKAIKTDGEGRVEVAKQKEQNFYGGGNETLPPGESFLVYENDTRSTLSYLEFSTDSIRTQIEIGFKRGGYYVPIGQVMKNGSGVAGLHVGQIVSHGSSLWKIMSYEDGAYKFALNTPLEFSEGLRISILNNDTEDINVACRVFGVEGVD